MKWIEFMDVLGFSFVICMLLAGAMGLVRFACGAIF